MTPNLLYVIVVGVLFATGVMLLLERSLTRVVMGVILLGNGANLLILLGGKAGGAPIVGTTPAGEMSDPLPQIMILTAIVITLGMTAFLLALAYRSWALTGHDEVQDDVEDRRIMLLAEQDEGPGTADHDDVHRVPR
jgi:multisubunit Na+/H+ antiporter MnhC subunit